jgi:hypothetical protein
MSDDFDALVKEHLEERDRAFENDDVDWARRLLPDNASHEAVELAFHRARAECTSISPEKRAESKWWLVARGLHPGIAYDTDEDEDVFSARVILTCVILGCLLSFLIFVLSFMPPSE